MANLINVRVQKEAEGKIGRYQADFRKGKCVVYQIFMLKQI